MSIALFVALMAATQPATAPAGVDPALWTRMVEINGRSQNIANLTADFEQRKVTPMLKRPLISTGRVTVAGASMRWDTTKPEPTVMLVDEKQVQLYYPKQKTLEIYHVDEHLGSLAASPLPRLDVLKKFFTFEQLPESDSSKLALRMTPIDPALREHVEQVRVLLDVASGYILRAEMVDSDGDRTIIAFSNIQS